MIVEVCASSLLSIKNAFQAGADRIELCSALEIGGLTPSLGLIKQSLEDNFLPIHCLIRPRQGHFFYSASEIKIIEQNIITNHSATNNLELLIQSFFLSFGIHSFITLVSKPKACQIISLCRDLWKKIKLIPGTKTIKKLNKFFGAQNILPSTSKSWGSIEAV